MLDELVHHIQDSRPKVIVVGKLVFEVAKKAAAQCGFLDRNIYVMEEEGHKHYKSIWSLVGKEELEPRRLSPKEVRERTAFMCYSSGTTGKAKGGAFEFVLKTYFCRRIALKQTIQNAVETTHYNLTSVIMQLVAADPEIYTDKERWLAIVPLYHMYGALCFIFLSRKFLAPIGYYLLERLHSILSRHLVHSSQIRARAMV